jgi:acyl-CoA thioesterase-1
MIRPRPSPLAFLAVVLCLALFAAVPKAPAAETDGGETVIVVLGDSLAAGLGLPQSDAFPAKLEDALKARGRKVKVIDAGVSGDTAAAGLARVDWSVPEDASGVIVEFGGNDALQGLDPAATKTALEKIIAHLQARGLPILLAGMAAPRNLGKDYVEKFDAIYPDLAERHGLVFYPFFLEGVALNDKLTFDDGMHPNAKGVERIVEGILPKVEELLVKTKG